MASLVTHIAAFLILFPTGLTRFVRSSSHFIKNPSLFRSNPYWFFSDQHSNSHSLDFLALSISLPISFFAQTILFLFFNSQNPNPTFRFSLAQQSTVLFLFSSLVLFISLRERVDFFRRLVTDGLVFLLAGISFLAEYWVAGNGVNGVFSESYGFIGLLALLCSLCSFYLSVKPSSFFAEFLLSSGMVFKATWVLQIGLCLYTETFGLKGCGRAVNLDDFKCELEEDGFRALALMRFCFVSQAVFVLVLGFVVFGVLAMKRRSNGVGGDRSGSLLSKIGSESSAIVPSNNLPELELE